MCSLPDLSQSLRMLLNKSTSSLKLSTGSILHQFKQDAKQLIIQIESEHQSEFTENITEFPHNNLDTRSHSVTEFRDSTQ